MTNLTYWNNESDERRKAYYWIEDVQDRRLLEHLENRTNLLRCFTDSLIFANVRLDALHGTVLDLGAGVCWTTAIVSRWPQVQKIYAYDFSEHRILKIAPLVLQQLNAMENKIERHCTNMFPLPHAAHAVDLVIFCQSFYMNGDSNAVLKEVHRVLKPGGVVMISCEGIERSEAWWRLWGRRAWRAMRQPSRWRQALDGRLPDVSGRYQYFDANYTAFIQQAGFEFAAQQLSYPVFPHTSSVLATNYFGIKTRREKI